MKILTFSSSAIFTLLLIVFLNGNFSIPGLNIPAFGKMLNPVHGIWGNTEKNSDFKDIQLLNNKISSPVKIIYDERKVPHIFASNLEDALFAQGYVEAKDRTFQLEFLQRFASGKLSEVLGERTLEVDREQRRKGLDYAAEKTAIAWKSMKDYQLLEKYIEGITTGINEVMATSPPVEFKLLGIEEVKWTPLSSARIMKWMSDVLCGRSLDISLTNLKEQLGYERFEMLYPEKPVNVEPVIPSENVYNFDSIYLPIASTGGFQKGQKGLKETKFSPPNAGSNNWAISGERSSTGRPIYCSDPHLQLTLPSVWFEVSIHTPEFHSYGVSIPGIPGIMMGFNENIAWGETNVAWDVKDYFQIKWVDVHKNKYELDGKEVAVEKRVERIPIKGQEDFLDTVLYTYWGPIQYEDKDLALRWLPHDVPNNAEYYTFIGTMMAKNYTEFLENTKDFVAPAQNFAFASASGDIALRVNGKFPALTKEDGRFIQDGTDSSNDWQAYIPREQNPQILNPVRGFISSANQRSTDDTYPYYYTGRFEHYRNRTLNEILSERKKFSPENMKAIQASSYSKKAEEILPDLMAKLRESPEIDSTNKYLTLLTSWDYTYDAESEAATFFELLYQKIANNTFDEISTLSESYSVRYPEDWQLNTLIIDYPEDEIFDIVDTEENENARKIIVQSFKAIEKEMEEMDIEQRAWGIHRSLDINHLARIPSFSALDLPLDGHPDALNAIGTTYGPSWRMIVALGENMEAYGVFPGGQSGNPLSRYYKLSLEKWSNLEYHSLKLFQSPEQINNPLFTVTMYN